MVDFPVPAVPQLLSHVMQLVRLVGQYGFDFLSSVLVPFKFGQYQRFLDRASLPQSGGPRVRGLRFQGILNSGLGPPGFLGDLRR